MSLHIRKVNGLGYLAVSVVAGITIIFLCDNSILQKKIYLKKFRKICRKHLCQSLSFNWYTCFPVNFAIQNYLSNFFVERFRATAFEPSKKKNYPCKKCFLLNHKDSWLIRDCPNKFFFSWANLLGS